VIRLALSCDSLGVKIAYLVQCCVFAIGLGYDLNGSLCAFGDVQARRNADIAQAELAEARHLELRVQDSVESISWVVADSEVNLYVGLLVAHGELNGCAADREVGALRCYSIETSARASRLFVLVKTTSLRVVEVEMRKCDRSEREREEGLGKHLGGGVLFEE
jgi:hypothetical protein